MKRTRTTTSRTDLSKPAPGTPSVKTITEAARSIRDLHRASGLQFACEVGGIVMNKLYAGDLAVLRDRGPKDASLRKLAQHPDLPLSASGLYQAIAIFELLVRLGGVHTCKHLGPSHVRSVLGLPEEAQTRLLGRADEQKWTVERLKSEVSRTTRPAGKGGRPPLPIFVKSLHALRRYVDRPELYFDDVEKADSLSEEHRQELRRVVQALRQRCDEIDEHLGEELHSEERTIRPTSDIEALRPRRSRAG